MSGQESNGVRTRFDLRIACRIGVSRRMIDAPSRSDKPNWLREASTYVVTLCLGVLAAWALHTTVAQPFTIPSSSMEPGLRTGDYILASKYPYGWSAASLPFSVPLGGDRLFGRTPRRGDVVLFRLPRDPRQMFIKRVIGTPGDRVQMIDGIVHLNGRPLPQVRLGSTVDADAPHRRVERVRETLPGRPPYELYDGGRGLGDDTGVFQVPPGALLVIGDNRDNSLDSRWPAEIGVGLAPLRNVVGRGEWIVLSWPPGSSPFKPWTWPQVRRERILQRIR